MHFSGECWNFLLVLFAKFLQYETSKGVEVEHELRYLYCNLTDHMLNEVLNLSLIVVDLERPSN